MMFTNSENFSSLDKEKPVLLSSNKQISRICQSRYLVPGSPCYIALRLWIILRLKFANLPNQSGMYQPFWNRNVFVKITDGIDLSEARTLKFFAENTTTPVPRLIIAFIYKGRTYIITRKTKDKSLLSAKDNQSDTRLNNMDSELLEDVKLNRG